MATHKEMHRQPEMGKIKIDKNAAIRILTLLDILGVTGLAVHFMAQNAVRDTSDVIPVTPVQEQCDAYQIRLGDSDSFVDLNGKEVDINASNLGIKVDPNEQAVVFVNQHPIVGNCVTEVKNG